MSGPSTERTGSRLEVRRAESADRPAVLELCRTSLGWDDGGTDEAFFAWKHDENPAGASPAWVAVAEDGSLAGLRVFMRWRFRQGDTALLGVRAVDTATHPDWRGKGVFSRLTLGALPGLRSDGVDFVFNTPNDQSRPGYLKMGWQLVGRMPFGVRFRPGVARHLGGVRSPAERWGLPTDVGTPAAQALASPELETLLARLGPRPHLATEVTVDWLRWRYRFGPLQYRVLMVNGTDPGDGLVVFRLRRRGPAVECTVCEVLVPPGVRPRRPLGTLLRRSGADMLLVAPGGLTMGTVPVPLGPRLTWRPIARPGVPGRKELFLTLGDLELF